MCSGSAPAMTALAATASMVALPSLGTSTATISSGSRRVPASIRFTRSAVGGIAGSPSPQPCSMSQPWNSSRSEDAPRMPPVAAPAAEAADGAEVSARNTLAATGSALAAATLGAMPPMGCGTVTTGSSGSPRAADWARARGRNSSVPTTTQATPLASSSAASWTLHDVHDPQSADAVSATRALLAISSRTAAVALTDEPGLLHTRTPRAPA